jgi:hypothetical protein
LKPCGGSQRTISWFITLRAARHTLGRHPEMRAHVIESQGRLPTVTDTTESLLRPDGGPKFVPARTSGSAGALDGEGVHR